MNDNLHYYRSELKSKNISKYKLIGISAELVLSVSLFPKNLDLIPFLNGVFNVSYKEYIMKSRTLIVARTIRLIYEMDVLEFEKCRKVILEFVNLASESNDKLNHKKKKNDSFEKWMDGINDESN